MTLTGELAAAQAACPGWHLWQSRGDDGQPTGHIYATHIYTAAERAAMAAHPACPGATTPDAVTLDLPGITVAVQRIHEWATRVLATGRTW